MHARRLGRAHQPRASSPTASTGSRARSRRLGIEQGDRVGTLRVEQPAPLRAVLRGPVHRRGAAHAQHPPVRRAAHLHRQPRRGPGDLRRRLARAACSRSSRRARGRRALRGDGRRRRRRACPNALRYEELLEEAGAGRVRLPRARRAPGRGALLHERHDRQPEGRALLAPLDQPALLGDADDATRNGLSRADRVLAVVPMFHANAWGLPYGAALAGLGPDPARPLPRRRAAGAR